ncbi:MAG: efflux RND transporter permease subunit [Leptospirales bacterium]
MNSLESPEDPGKEGGKRGRIGIAGSIARFFIDSRLTPIFVIVALLVGGLAVLRTPREEDPQIRVPMMDLFVPYPGAEPKEVEKSVTEPLERHLDRMKGVKAVYSQSLRGQAVVTVRFRVGESMDDSLVKVYNEVMKSRAYLPGGTGTILVKPKDINDVPVLAVTLSSRTLSDFDLTRIASRIVSRLKRLPGTGSVYTIGGRHRMIRIRLDPAAMKAFDRSPIDVYGALARSNVSLSLGSFDRDNTSFRVGFSGSLKTVEDVKKLVVGVSGGHTIRLSQIARVTDGPEPLSHYVWRGYGQSRAGLPDETAVTIVLAKKKGINAVTVAKAALRKVRELKGTLIPATVTVTVPRNYGHTANEKANDLLLHLLVATASVILLIGLALGIRETGIVAVAIPVTLSLTLFISMMIGYTINRVTLFALIFSIGILVDDAIVIVENIYRHFHFLGGAHDRKTLIDRAVLAVSEVGNPTILATFTVIGALLPMAFVSGLMGPYMRPIPVNASLAMIGSLLVALIVTPYLAIRLIRPGAHEKKATGRIELRIRHLYRVLMEPLIDSVRYRSLFLGGVVLLTVGSMLFFYSRTILLKMLPFDNKSEIDVVVDMPAGTTLEQTAAVVRALERIARKNASVRGYEAYVGTAAPFDFNGLVRHYYLRAGKDVGELHLDLLPKALRSRGSHTIAMEIERSLAAPAARLGARIKVVEVPPGPPVFAPITAELYGSDYDRLTKEGLHLASLFRAVPGIIDVDTSVRDPKTRYRVEVDQEKAALSGVSPSAIGEALSLALHGESGTLHTSTGKGHVPILLEYPERDRSNIRDLSTVFVRGGAGRLIPVRSLVHVEKRETEEPILRKNLRPVVYITGNTIGSSRSPVYAAVDLSRAVSADAKSRGVNLRQIFTGYPWSTDSMTIRWGGEWQVTYVTFRDMGIAFGAAIILIYLLIVAEFESFVTPLVIMSPIPLALIGVIPGHILLGSNFTATSMIGFIALAGIMVRNSILLVDFLHAKKAEGVPIRQAILETGAVRTRPILLTAAALIAGSFVILSDPIFRGMAIALLFGSIVSTLLTLFVVPLLILIVEGKSWSIRRHESGRL